MTITSLRERKLIEELSKEGMSDRQIGERLNLSCHTVRKWRRRLRREGKSALYSRMGRPKRGAMSSFPEAMREQVSVWRRAHPGWGPKTLKAELQRHADYAGQRIASRPTLARWLKEAGLSRRYEKHQELPHLRLSPSQACHEEWEMDARGHEKVAEIGVISLINVNDLYSRVKLISYPCWLGQERLTRYPDTEDYQLVLRLTFTKWGLPKRIAVDRADVFYDAQSTSPFPTRFHLWLLALGVELTFGRPGQPRDQAVTERSHKTWWQQVLEGQLFGSLSELWHALDERQAFLNLYLPCETLGGLPPLLAHPEALSPQRLYRPEWEEELLDLTRIYTYLGQCRWFRRSSKVGTVSLGGHNYSLGKDWYACQVEVTFDAQQHSFIFRAPPRQDLRLPIRWLTKQSLMGEAGALARLPNFQLALPFSRNDWRILQTCSLSTGTILWDF
jgi:transposase